MIKEVFKSDRFHRRSHRDMVKIIVVQAIAFEGGTVFKKIIMDLRSWLWFSKKMADNSFVLPGPPNELK